MSTVTALKTKPVGEILMEAGLVNHWQIELALKEQEVYPDLKLGDILVLHGWINRKTADFFGDKVCSVIDEYKRKIGEYFCHAGLISEQQIDSILNEQKRLGLQFGSVAVLQGVIPEKALDFYLKYLPEKTIVDSPPSQINKEDLEKAKTTTINSYEDLAENELDDIPWHD